MLPELPELTEQTLTIDGRTLVIDQRVMTPYGPGSIFAFDPGNQLPIGVQVANQGDWGSRFWFASSEVKEAPQPTDA